MSSPIVFRNDALATLQAQIKALSQSSDSGVDVQPTSTEEVSEEVVEAYTSYQRVNLTNYCSSNDYIAITYLYLDIIDTSPTVYRLSFDGTFKQHIIGTTENIIIDIQPSTAEQSITSSSDQINWNMYNSNHALCYTDSTGTHLNLPAGIEFYLGQELYFTGEYSGSNLTLNDTSSTTVITDTTEDTTTGTNNTYDYVLPAIAGNSGLYMNWTKFNIITRSYDSQYIGIEYEGSVYDTAILEANTWYIVIPDAFMTTDLPCYMSESESDTSGITWMFVPAKGLCMMPSSEKASSTAISGTAVICPSESTTWSLLYSSVSSNTAKTQKKVHLEHQTIVAAGISRLMNDISNSNNIKN